MWSKNLSDFLFVSFCVSFVWFVLLLEGSGEEANEHDVKKMELLGVEGNVMVTCNEFKGWRKMLDRSLCMCSGASELKHTLNPHQRESYL